MAVLLIAGAQTKKIKKIIYCFEPKQQIDFCLILYSWLYMPISEQETEKSIDMKID